MALNPFFKVARETLEEWLEAAQQEAAAGKSISYWQGGDMATGHAAHGGLDPLKRIELIYRELSRQDPKTYPPSQLTRQSVVAVTFKDSPY